MAAECVNHSAMEAGLLPDIRLLKMCIDVVSYFLIAFRILSLIVIIYIFNSTSLSVKTNFYNT